MNGEMRLREVVPGLYEIGISPSGPAASPSPPGQVCSYFLSRQDVSPTTAPTLGEAWSDPRYIGWFIFLAAPVTRAGGERFVREARVALPDLSSTAQPNLRALVWLHAPDALTGFESLVFYQLSANPDIRTPANSTATLFQWAPLTLTLQPGVRIGFDFDALAFLITTDPGNTSLINLGSGLSPSFYDTSQYTWFLPIPVLGAGAGAFHATLGLDLGALTQQLACNLRFFFGQADGVATLDYPFYPPVAPGSTIPGFAVRLHPLFHTDPAWTRFALDFGGATPNRFQTQARALRAGFFRTAAGGTICLAPHPVEESSPGAEAPIPPGFAFCRAPGTDSPALAPPSHQLYLAPVGTYQVMEIDSPASSPQPVGEWMCGLSGQEYLELATGDLLAFQSPMPAYAPQLGQGSASGPALEGRYTTAWLQFPLPGPAPAERRYFGQPSASVYYTAAAPGELAYPVAALLARLDAPICFPMVPYGGIFSNPLFNGGVTADTFAAFESQVLTNERHARATARSGGPVFLRPSTAGLALLEEASLATAVTPQGFVVHLNGDGTWSSIELARSPDAPSCFLTFSGSGSPSGVNPTLASTLLQDELFLVVSDAALLGTFLNEVGVGGFNFKLDVGRREDGPVTADTTLLVFKFNTSTSLEELVNRPELWAERERFVRDLPGTLAQLRAALAAAGTGAELAPPDEHALRFAQAAGSPAGDDLFSAFRQLAKAPEWTGVLAFNCAIDGKDMPPGLQMLLGGINGQLRAHHFGIQRNRLTHVEDLAAIDQSSLFGVIAYPSPSHPLPPLDTTDDFDFETEKLQVVFENSRVTSFNVLAGLTVNRLFGREVELVSGGGRPSSPHNTLQIAGRYQRQDGVGTVTFSTSQPFLYRFPVPEGTSRVLDHILFDRATLVPLSTEGAGSPQTGSPGGTQVRSRFSLGGALWFNPEPFQEAPGVDLFSYGNPGASQGGLGFEELAVDISFTLDGEGALAPGTKRVTGNLSRLRPVESPGAIRPGSLLASIPLQLSRFLISDKGFSAASLGATPVHVVQLEHGGGAGRQLLAASPSPRASTPAPNTTTMPQFGLQFDLPLGSLGALSSVHAGLMARLVIGWGPSRVIPDTDAAAVLVQLPQLFAGYGSFELQGILKTTFGDANLLRVDLERGPVYAILFNNIQLSVLGFGFPPGLVVDFLIFAGQPEDGAVTNDRNLAWFLGAFQPSQSPERA